MRTNHDVAGVDRQTIADVEQYSVSRLLDELAVTSAGTAVAAPTRATKATSNSVRGLTVSASRVQGHGSGDARCFPAGWGERDLHLQRQVMVAFERSSCLGVERHREGPMTGANRSAHESPDHLRCVPGLRQRRGGGDEIDLEAVSGTGL